MTCCFYSGIDGNKRFDELIRAGSKRHYIGPAKSRQQLPDHLYGIKLKINKTQTKTFQPGLENRNILRLRLQSHFYLAVNVN